MTLHVRFHEKTGQWFVRKSAESKLSPVGEGYATQSAAIVGATRRFSESRGGDVVVHAKNGAVVRTVTVRGDA